ncbi:MAG TPA: hypothetical protein VH416_01995 [Gaiellaceae bacterium]|jgi:hypothetical protein
MYARMARYRYTGDAHELGRRAEDGILPTLRSQPGFAAYSVAVGDDEILSLSVWGSRAEAEAGSEAVAGWVAENMASELDLIEIRYAELLFSTSLGITTSAAATA